MTGFNLLIDRVHPHSASIIGKLYANREFVCYTLELPWRWNARTVSCVPPGSYSAFIRYDKPDGWRIQLENVPERSGVQIHIGNYPRNVKGCVLVGTSYGPNAVWHSKDAYAKLKAAFYGESMVDGVPIACPAKRIRVAFKGILSTPAGDFPIGRSGFAVS